MVAGKVKAAMGFQRSPATPKTTETTRTPSSTFRRASCSPASARTASHSGGNSKSSNSGAAAVFSRSFGVYFPRPAPAQVQPRPPDVAELLRIVEELQERESRLRTELLEYKLAKETAQIVPFLESEINSREQELERRKQKIEKLEAENLELKAEIEIQKAKSITEHERVKNLEAEVVQLKRLTEDYKLQQQQQQKNQENVYSEDSGRLSACGEATDIDDCSSSFCSSSQSFNIMIREESAKSNGSLKCLSRKETKSTSTDILSPDQESNYRNRDHESNQCSRNRSAPRVPKPPPTRCSNASTPCSSSSSSTSSSTLSSSSETCAATKSRTSPELSKLPPIPPPPPPPPSRATAAILGKRGPPPPPPPPPPSKGAKSTSVSVRRVPEVVEFYHSIMRRDSRRENSDTAATPAASAAAANARNMIGEIENRSSHLLAIKSDVETQGDLIRFLIKEVENSAFTNIEDVVSFVKWLDDELSFLVDERAVLKHFNWPEQKADAMREAAFGYCDLKKLESEASSFVDDLRQPCSSALKKMQALLEKLEHKVYNLSRARETTGKKYQAFQIPNEWMLESGVLISQIKLASVKLAMKYVKRVSSELELVAGGPDEEELMLQGVRFAFRVHQFAGGFDVETMKAFQELKEKARSFRIQNQSQSHNQQQKTYSRSATCLDHHKTTT